MFRRVIKLLMLLDTGHRKKIIQLQIIIIGASILELAYAKTFFPSLLMSSANLFALAPPEEDLVSTAEKLDKIKFANFSS